MEQILPYSIKLQLARLNFAIDGLVLEQPELFNELKTAFELIVVPKNNVEYLFVLALSMDESVQSLS